jgi:hypothetical protein
LTISIKLVKPGDRLNSASAEWSYSAEAFAKGGENDREVSAISVFGDNSSIQIYQIGWKVIHCS